MSDIILKPSDWNIQQAKYNVQPGDRLIMQYDCAEIELHDLKGTKDKPIILTALTPVKIKGVVPGGRVVTYYNCQHVRITGDPNGDGSMNLNISGGAQGVDFRELSSGVEADHLTIDVGYSGLNAKTDPTCDPKTWRGAFVLDGVYFHHNDISTKTGEGIYVGESHYHSTFPLSGCASGVKSAKEHEVKNVVVEDNLIRTSGADGIQVGSCPTGAVIRRNNVLNSGTAKVYGQTAGIIANPGTVAQIYDNWIEKCNGFAIQLQGPGGSKVHNNIIAGSGSAADGGGIMQVNYAVEGISVLPQDDIYNNTFVGINRVGLEYYGSVAWRDNILQMSAGVLKKQGGSAGKLTLGKNIEVIGNSEQLKLDTNYAPTAASAAYVADYSLPDIGAVTSVKLPPAPKPITFTGAVRVVETGAQVDIFVDYGNGTPVLIYTGKK